MGRNSYIRISTSLQDLKNQKNSINEFARKNNFIVENLLKLKFYKKNYYIL